MTSYAKKIMVRSKYRLERFVLRYLMPAFALLLIKFFRLLGLEGKIAFCPIIAPRIGHLVANTELFLRRLNADNYDKEKKYIGVYGTCCNEQLMKMIKRQMPVFKSRILRAVLETPSFQKSVFFQDMPFNSNEYLEFNNLSQVIDFTEEEEMYGREELKRMGIGSDDWFVCFHNRDGKYLDTVHGVMDWSYHDYRDCNISNFLPAMEYVTSCGGYAIRLGQHMASSLDHGGNPRIIDYASKCRSDFMDIYLSSHCKFFVGCTAGLHMVPVLFDVPLVMTNTAHVEYPALKKGNLFIPKRMRSLTKNREFTFGEIFGNGIGGFHGNLAFEGVEMPENSSKEILDVVKEMNQLLDGQYKYSEEDERLQKKYWSLVKPTNACYGCPARVGKDFLAKNEYLLK